MVHPCARPHCQPTFSHVFPKRVVYDGACLVEVLSCGGCQETSGRAPVGSGVSGATMRPVMYIGTAFSSDGTPFASSAPVDRYMISHAAYGTGVWRSAIQTGFDLITVPGGPAGR